MIETTKARVLAGDEQALQLYEALVVQQALQLALADNTDRMLLALQGGD
jgi:hypothetical protein